MTCHYISNTIYDMKSLMWSVTHDDGVLPPNVDPFWRETSGPVKELFRLSTPVEKIVDLFVQGFRVSP